MSQKENRNPYQDGTEHGYLSFGEVNTFSNEIDACKIANGPDAGRHYIRLQETGSKEDGSKGSTNIVCPGCLLYTSPSPRDGLLSRMPSSA